MPFFRTPRPRPPPPAGFMLSPPRPWLPRRSAGIPHVAPTFVAFVIYVWLRFPRNLLPQPVIFTARFPPTSHLGMPSYAGMTLKPGS